MKKLLVAALLAVGISRPGESRPVPQNRFFGADDARIQYTERVDFTDSKKPHFWALVLTQVLKKRRLTGRRFFHWATRVAVARRGEPLRRAGASS